MPGWSRKHVMSESAERRQVFRLPRERRVSDLMAAARTVFSEKGYQDTSTAEIAERAGVVEGTIYRYFSNKRDLLIKVVEAWYDEMISDYDEQLEPDQRHLEQAALPDLEAPVGDPQGAGAVPLHVHGVARRSATIVRPPSSS